MLRVMARPMPEPVCLVVKKGSNIRAMSSADMPTPRSGDGDLDCSSSSGAPHVHRRRDAAAPPLVGASRRDIRLPRQHGVARVGDDVDQRLAQALDVGLAVTPDGASTATSGGPAWLADPACAASRTRPTRSTSSYEKAIGRA